MARGGRVAAITNVRQPDQGRSGTRSRGHLVRDFLQSRSSATAFAAAIAPDARHYGAYNLLLGDGRTLLCQHSLSGETEILGPGYHGLSNARLNTPWPKLQRSLNRLRAAVEHGPTEQNLLALLADDTPAADHELPDTGLSRAGERRLSAPFIRGNDYGTRASTALTIAADGSTVFVEQGFAAGGTPTTRHRFTLQLANAWPPPPQAG